MMRAFSDTSPPFWAVRASTSATCWLNYCSTWMPQKWKTNWMRPWSTRA